jgi:hypothetical protein
VARRPTWRAAINCDELTAALRRFNLIPFRLLGIAFEGVFGLLRAIVLLPVRVLEGGRRV